jgi:hypothetical protein
MIFYRSAASGSSSAGPSIRTLRVLTCVALVAYPLGVLVRRFVPDGGGWSWFSLIAGFGLILLALVAATPVMGSRLQRIVADEKGGLDEMEMLLRHKALSWSYGVLAAALLLFIIYLAIATDAGGWVPDDYEEWNGLFWGAFLYVTLLPTARLAWTMDPGMEHEG